MQEPWLFLKPLLIFIGEKNMSKELVKCPICDTERIIIRQHKSHPNTTKFWCNKCNKTVEPINN